MSLPTRRTPFRLALTASCMLAVSCVEVQTFYRDAPATNPDTPGLDVSVSEDVRPMVGADATRAVLASIGERVILAALREFDERAVALEAATLAAVTGGPAELEAARLAWRQAQAVWQRLESLQLGPAGLLAATLGGRGLRDDIVAWPLLTRCRIDQHTVGPAHGDAALLAVTPIDARGLGAVEYLLFFEDPSNGCSATSAINMDGSWAALGDAEVMRRRLLYAHTAAIVVREHASELRTAWEPAGGNFLGELANAGAGSATYATAQQGLNAVSDALVYLYKEVVDFKLGIPAGLRLECVMDTCPDQVESRWAAASLAHVRANLEGFRDAYLGAPAGTEGEGFDDLLRSIGATELDARIQTQFAAAFLAFEAIDDPLELAVLTDHPDVVALHDALRLLADTFRVEVVSVLNLEPSMRIEGDND